MEVTGELLLRLEARLRRVVVLAVISDARVVAEARDAVTESAPWERASLERAARPQETWYALNLAQEPMGSGRTRPVRLGAPTRAG